MNSAQLRFLSMLVLLLLVVSTGIAQTSTSAAKATARISGRVTIDGEPAQGVEVMLRRGDDRRIQLGVGIPPILTATTDAEGRYKFSDVAAGGYIVSVHAPAYALQVERRRRSDAGKGLNVSENDNLENVDLTMTRGGVVTGKVTDEDGRPVIAESVTVFRLDQQGKRIQTNAFEPFGREETDDQGIYRIFGIEAGRYLVAAGSSPEEINTRMGAFYRRTFHPDTTDESKAKVIDIKPGGENENVDIRVARSTKGYAASGRVIDAETGKPVPGVMIHYGILKETGRGASASFNLVNWPTNSAGEFRLEGLSPNNYKVGVVNLGKSDFYSDQVDFEIVSGDVTGLEIKLSRGASISGVAVVEGSRDPAILGALSKIELRVFAGDSQMKMGDGGGQRRILGSLLMAGLCAASAFAQRATGAITGRLVADDGQPVRHATVSISSMGGGGRIAGRLTVVSDEDGNFQAEGLDPIPYTISATAPGYVLDPKKQRETNYSFIGQPVTITMMRGGVITGKVTS